MPSVYDLKPRFQGLLRPLVRWLAAVGVTPNQVTVAALALSVLVGALVAGWPAAHWPLLLLPVVLFLHMALNAVDGMLAREYDMRSPLGAVLNELGDVVSDAALYLPLAWVPGFEPIAVVAAVVLGIIGEMAGVVAVQIGATRRYDGPLGKSDRALAFGGLGLLLGLGVPGGIWLDALLWVLVLLAAVTIVNRARQALAETA